jgi:hypothetical protein
MKFSEIIAQKLSEFILQEFNALLLLKRVEEANKIYFTNVGKALQGGENWGQVIKADLDRLSKDGQSSPHMPEIKAAIEQREADLKSEKKVSHGAAPELNEDMTQLVSSYKHISKPSSDDTPQKY